MAIGINGRRNIDFYTLRHTLMTVGMELNNWDAGAENASCHIVLGVDF